MLSNNSVTNFKKTNMSVLNCKIGIHAWEGCICSACGKHRDEHHDTTADCSKCAKCGKDFGDIHHWSKNCNKCSVCGKEREDHHDWIDNCEKCHKCGTTRYNAHILVDGICKICSHGILKDPIDDKTYKVIKIGKQVIMAENLFRIPDDGKSWSFDDKESNAVKYGHLYDYVAAQSINFKGWHLPTREEWETLFNHLGTDEKKVFENLKHGGQTDFNGLNAGWRNNKGAYTGLGASAHFWCNTKADEHHIWQFVLHTSGGKANFEKAEPSYGLSIRLFKD